VTVESSSIVRGEPFGDERVIRSLSGRTGVPPGAIRILFSKEFARLELGARVRSYLPALTAANVRALLRSAGKTAAGAR
jgi:Protein of unknown function (DUF3562)